MADAPFAISEYRIGFCFLVGQDRYFVKNRFAYTTYLVRFIVFVEALEHEFISDLVIDDTHTDESRLK